MGSTPLKSVGRWGWVVAIAEDNTTLRSVGGGGGRRKFVAHWKGKKSKKKVREVLKQETDTAIYLEKENKIMTWTMSKGKKEAEGGGGGHLMF